MNTTRVPIHWILLGGLWLLLTLIPLFNRTFLQIDETRYITVAWEMWLRQDGLLPSLNGALYHHKPPLLFWLIHLGWAIFGVNEWWPRLIPSFFSLGSLALTIHLARQLWPQSPHIAQWAPFILLTTLLWSLFTSALMFDMVLSFFVLLGLVALVHVWQMEDFKGWGLFGLAIGLGILTKGPVILLHLLPVALTAAWWQPTAPKRSWYIGVFSSVLIGGAIALTWAIPAGLQGGPAFREALFWGQTAHRLVNSFAHNHPIWWYLPLLPLALFPWILWPPIWRGLSNFSLNNSGIRFCLIGLVLVFTAFSFISGKQIHYLLPLFPSFALLAAYFLNQNPVTRRWDNLWIGVVILLIGGLLLMIPTLLMNLIRLPLWFQAISPFSGIGFLILGLSLIRWPPLQVHFQVYFLSLAAVLFSLILPLTIIRAAGPAYNLHEISQKLKTLQDQQQTIAHFGDYHGQYQFLGRLPQPLEVVDEYNICAWSTQHPEGQLVVYFSDSYQQLSEQATYVQPYRSKQVGIIGVSFIPSACVKIMPLL